MVFLEVDLSVLLGILSDAGQHVRAQGSLWIVVPSYIPLGNCLHASGAWGALHRYTNGKFSTWCATKMCAFK
eukprot:2920532-Amphidinium_carterae.1